MMSKGMLLAAEIAEMANAALGLPELRRTVLERLQREIGYETAFWGDRSRVAVRSALDVYRTSHGRARQSLERYAAARERYDLPETSQIVRAARGVTVDVEVFSAAQRDRLPLYVEVLRPAGIRTYLACDVAFRGNPSSFFALCRHGRGVGFTTRDKDVLHAIKSTVGLAEAAFSGRAPVPEPAQGRLESYGLSPREAQIATMLLSGLQNKEIAALLGTSPDTVRKQTIRIYEKAGVSTRGQFAARVANFARHAGRRGSGAGA